MQCLFNIPNFAFAVFDQIVYYFLSKQLFQLSPDDHMLGIDNVGLDFAELDLIIRW